MTRAELRREKRAKAKNPTYNLTEEQLNALVRDRLALEMKNELDRIRQEVSEDAINTAMILTLSLPMKVLMEYYWPKSYEKRIPEFTEHLLDYFADWQEGKLDILELRKDIWNLAGVKLEQER